MTDQTPPPSSTPPSPPPPRRFTRSREDKVIAGVCGGLARYFGIDPVLVRIAAVALLFVGGLSAIAYLAAIVFVPEDGDETERSGSSRVVTIVAVVVLVVAGFAALDNLSFGIGWGWWLGPLIPLGLLAALLIFAGRRMLERRGERDAGTGRLVGVVLMTLAALILAGAAAIGAAWATAAGGGEVVAGVIIALGVAMVIASFRGGARWLALPALALALPAGVVAAADIDVDGGVGDRTYRPASVRELPRDGYQLGVGELVVDLRRMEWPGAEPVRLKLDLGVGHAVVYLPTDVCVRSDADAGVGYVDVLGDDSGGIDVRTESGALVPSRTPGLILDTQIGVGALEVRHEGHDGYRDRPGEDHDYISPELERANCGGQVA